MHVTHLALLGYAALCGRRAARLHMLLGLPPAQALGHHVIDIRGKPPALRQVCRRILQLRREGSQLTA